jgi:hypothetical protein
MQKIHTDLTIDKFVSGDLNKGMFGLEKDPKDLTVQDYEEIARKNNKHLEFDGGVPRFTHKEPEKADVSTEGSQTLFKALSIREIVLSAEVQKG